MENRTKNSPSLSLKGIIPSKHQCSCLIETDFVTPFQKKKITTNFSNDKTIEHFEQILNWVDDLITYKKVLDI